MIPTAVQKTVSPPGPSFGYALRFQDLTTGHHLERHARVWRVADDIELFESGWTSDHFYAIHHADPSDPCLEG